MCDRDIVIGVEAIKKLSKYISLRKGIDSNENIRKHHKKLERTNKRYLVNHENKKYTIFYALFFNNGDDFFADGMTVGSMVTLIPRQFIN